MSKLKAFFNHVKFTDIDDEMYQEFILYLQDEEELAENTIRNYHSTGKMIFEYGIKKKLISKDPTKFTVIPKKFLTVEDIENQKIYHQYYEKDELLLFLNTAKEMSILIYTFFYVLAYTGLRTGELISLKWSDIDFVNEIIKVQKTYYSESGRIEDFELTAPKSISSIRDVDVEAELLDLLKLLKIEQDKIKQELGELYTDYNLVFARLKDRSFGFPICHGIIGRAMDNIINKSGLKKRITPHGLRHTHTSILASSGSSLPEIMARLGHKNDVTTLQIYLHITKDKRKESSKRFSEYMNK